MPERDVDLPIEMGVGGVLSRALSVVVSDRRLPLAALIGSVCLLVPFLGPFVLVAFLGLAFGVADEALGYAPPSTSFLRRVVVAILATVLAGLAVVIGLVFFLAPGIYLAIKFALVVPAVWIGGKGPFGALADSWELTTAKRRTVSAVGLVFLCLTTLVALVAFLAVVPALRAHQIGEIVTIPGSYPRIRLTMALVSGVVAPLWTAAWAVMYRGFPYP